MSIRYAVWQATLLNSHGEVQPAVTIEVRDAITTDLVTLYEDILGETVIAPPLLTDDSGFVRFYVAEGRYRITATKSTFVNRVWEDVLLIGDQHGEQVLDASIVSPAGGTYNDYALSAAAEIMKIDSSDGALTFTGFDAGPFEGVTKRIMNDGANDITLKHNDTGSIEGNRILLPGAQDFIIPQYACATLWLDFDPDTEITVWRLI